MCEPAPDTARADQYVEVDWARTYYTLGHEVDANLAALGMHYANGTAFGDDALTKIPNGLTHDGSSIAPYHFNAYDFRSKEMQQKWTARITDAVATGVVDGAFIDGNRGGWGFGNCNACDKKDKKCCTDLKAGLEAAHIAAAKALPNATLISNYPTPEALKVCSGGMCERCGHGPNTVRQLHDTYFGKNKCGLHGQPCVLQYRCYGNNGQHGHETFTPYQDIANQSIATFLLAAGPYSYYVRAASLCFPSSNCTDFSPSNNTAHCCLQGGGSESGIGPQACNMSDGSMHFPDWPDVHRPLGTPQGDFQNASVGSDVYLTRVFKTAAGTTTRVVMNATGGDTRDTAGNFKCVYWADGFVTGERDCSAPDLATTPVVGGFCQSCPPKGSALLAAAFAGWQ